MAMMRVWILLSIFAFSLSNAQNIRTVNGTMLIEINGATLALSAPGVVTQSSSASSSLAHTSDVNAAVQNAIAQTQPQVLSHYVYLKYVGLIEGFLLNLPSLFLAYNLSF